MTMITSTMPWPERSGASTLLGGYQRRLSATVEGVWRNVLDYEHLPWVHAHAFAGVRRLAGGSDWWRAEVTLAPAKLGKTMTLELCVDRARRRYVTRTLAGVSAGGYIVTQLAAVDDEHTDIEVEFWGEAESEGMAKIKGQGYLRLYQRLWDEDEQMIVEMLAADRHEPWRPEPGAQLQRSGPREARLGERRLGVVERGELAFVHDRVCPHMGGPLIGAALDDQGRLRCPWHDFRFDLGDGRCDRMAARLPCRVARSLGEGLLEV